MSGAFQNIRQEYLHKPSFDNTDFVLCRFKKKFVPNIYNSTFYCKIIFSKYLCSFFKILNVYNSKTQNSILKHRYTP